MKKNIILSLLILLSIKTWSQEKGSYLTISGGMGPSGINYKMTKVNFATPDCELKLGGQAGIGYSYYFTKHIGISTGIFFSHYRTNGKLMGDFISDKYLVLGNYTDDDFPGNVKEYEVRVRTKNWVEKQSVKFMEIPLTLNLQKKFGEKEYFGLYLAVGAKLQIPVSAKYSVVDGDNSEDSKFHVSGYYEKKNLELGALGAPDVSQYGFGAIYNPSQVLTNANGNLNLKWNLSLIAEAGFLISLSKRIDISLGAFIDYGLLNINNKNESVQLFNGPKSDYVALAENNNVGKGISYNSITKTEYVNEINTISYGGKVGIRIKLGKLAPKLHTVNDLPKELIPLTQIIRDTVYIVEKQNINMDSIVQKVTDAVNLIAKLTPEEIQSMNALPEEEKLDYYPGVYPDEEMKLLFEPIYFDLNKSNLKPESIKNLDRKISILKKYKDIKLIIFGNTCDIGNDPYNFQLGYKRAESARDYLLSGGITKERLQISTMSKFEPELPNTNEENRMHNRRDDFKPIFPGNK
ncbi:MAG: OmpA family protein [Bacteroidales bacterium]|jgi:outer membrane protein OmpA-like peptidoglycan-associated protein|nr:OmpA family protein [Bacteroidales bacterium]